MSVLGYGALAFGLIFLCIGTYKLRQGYLIWRNEPVSAENAHIQEGIVEVEGTARPVDEDSLFEAKYTDDEVIAHDWAKQKQKEKDGSKRQRWRTEESGEDAVPFYVEDETGRIAVDPEDATLDIEGEVVNRTPALKKRVGKLEPGEEVHVFGERQEVTERRDDLGSENVYVGDGRATPVFRITDADEEEVLKSLTREGGIFFFGGCFFIAMGVPLL